jgi:hypothetical protein
MKLFFDYLTLEMKALCLSETSGNICYQNQKSCKSLICLFVCLSVPPSIYPPEDEIHVVSASQSESLSCLVSGYPQPEIQWHRNGMRVSNDKHIRYVLCVSGAN